MNATVSPVDSLAAAEVMRRDLVVVPRQMPVRQAARLLHQAQASAAAVVEEHGRCVGMLAPADVFRWVAAGSPDAIVGQVHTCPYQVRGRLVTGEEALVCILAHESCPYQESHAGLSGRHTDVCIRPETANSPFGTVPCYMTTDVVTVRPEAPLSELVRQFIDTRADHIIVLDECERPIGLVSATDALSAARMKDRSTAEGRLDDEC